MSIKMPRSGRPWRLPPSSERWRWPAAAAAPGASSGSGGTINLVGFSILEQANKSVIADFNKTSDGKDVTFKQSYGASGDQSRAVIGGQKADIVHLSLEPDVQKLVDAKLVVAELEERPRPRAS